MENNKLDIAPALLLNYFKIALRKIKRQKGYILINISGLAVGLACCAIMMLWVRNEKSFDHSWIKKTLISLSKLLTLSYFQIGGIPPIWKMLILCYF